MAGEPAQRVDRTRRSRIAEAVPLFNVCVCAALWSCLGDGEEDGEVMQVKSARIDGIDNLNSVGQSAQIHGFSSVVGFGSCAASP